MSETNTKIEQFLDIPGTAPSTKKKVQCAMFNHRIAMEHVLEAKEWL
jgi:hypothetical protein